MNPLRADDVMFLLLSLGLMLGFARAAGELARRFRQPAVLGEIIAGILLGQTVFGALFPNLFARLFPIEGPLAAAQSGVTTIAVTLFLLVAGLEVDLSRVGRQGRAAFTVSTMGMAVPFAIGAASAWLFPHWLNGDGTSRALPFALFFGTALAISALPVIAKILLDLGLYQSDLGMLVIAAAMMNDLAGWLVFSVVIGMMGVGHSASIGLTILLTVGFAAAVLTVGRSLCHRALPWVQAHTAWPGGVLVFTLALALLGGAVTEWIGIHAIFGAFLVGMAVGDSSHLRERTRETINQFITNVFAPLFFASIGLRVNFLAEFNLALALVVCLLATVGKFVGCGWGAWWAGLDRKTGLAVAAGLNARGAMEIILGLLALNHGLIGPQLFVALVVMALVTSLLSGPLMERIVGSRRALSVLDVIDAKSFVPALQGQTAPDTIRELSVSIAPRAALATDEIFAAVWQRECTMSTALGNRVAVPHARMAVRAPCVAVGLSKQGIDFNAADGEMTHAVFLILTDVNDQISQLQILASIARLMRDPATRERALNAATYAEFRAALNVAQQIGSAA